MTRVDISPAAAVHKLAAHAPDRAAVIYEDRPISFAALAGTSARLAGVLRGAGVGRGDRVAYLGLNSPAFFASYLAAAWLGAVYVPINYRLTALEVRQILVDAQVAVILAEAGHHAIAERAAAGLPARRLLVDDDPCDPHEIARDPAWTWLGAALAEAAPGPPPEVLREDDPAMLAYTSGTTGKAKGVALSHGNLWWNSANLDHVAGMRCDDVNLVASPLFHTASFGCFTARALVRGATSVIRRSLEPGRVLADLVARRVTTLFAVPAMLRAIARLPGFATADLSRLAVAVTAGAPAPRPVLAEYLARGIVLQQAYGLTEVLFATCVPVARARDTLGSVGVALPFTEIRIAPEGESAAPARAPDRPDAAGEVGEVWVRGPTVTGGYWRAPDATELALRSGGWFRTGDLGYLDRAGNLVIADRKKDMIIVAGDNVYSGEVERILADHPAIAEVAVVGIGDETWGETVVAAVVLHDGAPEPTLAELRRVAAPHLAAYKLPVRLAVLEALPRNAMGKVDKTALRERLTAQREPPGREGAVASPLAAAPPPALAVPAVAAAGAVDPATEATTEATTDAIAAAWARRLAAMSPAARQRTLVELVQGAIASMMPHAPASSIGERTPLLDLGLGSLAAAELASRLAAATGLGLPTTLVFDHPTVGALARHLGERLGTDRAAAAPPPRAGAAPPADLAGALARLESASDEDLFHLLDHQLDVR